MTHSRQCDVLVEQGKRHILVFWLKRCDSARADETA